MTDTPNSRRPPEFNGERLLVIGTGAIMAMHLPYWLNWLIMAYPDLEMQVVLTPSAERFVSGQALSVLVRREVLHDRWPEEAAPDALHVRLADWSDCAIVYPACMNFVSRLALGLADTPALLTLQCTRAAIVVAPALPPGAMDNPTLTRHLASLAERPNVVVAPVQAATSLSTGRRDAAGAPPLWTVIDLLEKLRQTQADDRNQGPGSGLSRRNDAGDVTGGATHAGNDADLHIR